ncbi:MAG: hypothetical protein ACK492_08855 [Chitinophagaceae bacterium]
MRLLLFVLSLLFSNIVFSQEAQKDTIITVTDTIPAAEPEVNPADSVLRITNLNPFFTLQVDSVFVYDLEINKPPQHYFWFLKNAPIGLKIDKNTGVLFFKADKSFFKSGKLKYDIPYKVEVGIQNLRDAKDRSESSFTLMFYNTEVIVSRLKPTIGSTIQLEEGDSLQFRVQCEEGSFPIEQININSNYPISDFKAVNKCDDEFKWMVPYDFIRDNDTSRQKILVLQFIGTDKFRNADTATIRLFIKTGVNYPQKNLEHLQVVNEIKKYVTNLKLTFYMVSKNIKTNKNTRTTLDITGSSTAMLGTIISTSGSSSTSQSLGKILPSVGLTLVPVKEAVSPNKVQEQNTASQIRGTIKRLDYIMTENMLVGDRDPEILSKSKKLRDELKQSQLQLVDLPLVEFDPRYSEKDADAYFNNPKVNKKYKLKVQ